MGNKQFTEATKPIELVSLFLDDEELADLGNASSAVDASVSGARLSEKRAGKQSTITDAGGSSGVRDFWNEEGDGFFGQSNPAPPSVGMEAEDDMTPPPAEMVVAKKKGKVTGAKRGRKKKVTTV